MSLFNKYEGCRGITIFRGKKRNIEVWYCPSNYTIPEHSHPKEDIELMFIFGHCKFYRRNPDGDYVSAVMRPFNVGRTFSIPAGFYHYFTSWKLPLIFVNFSTFIKGYIPRSAVDDFKLMKEERTYGR